MLWSIKCIVNRSCFDVRKIIKETEAGFFKFSDKKESNKIRNSAEEMLKIPQNWFCSLMPK